MNPPRVLAAAGLWGAILTVTILAMSVLLRLGTEMKTGVAVSTLPADVEQWARIAHRIAAAGVGFAAALAFVAAWRGGSRHARVAVGWVIALTLLLSVVGRYSPGYRFDLVTVVNVAGGVALAAAFWALRPHGDTRDGVALAALGVLVVLTAAGAAADASAMRGGRDFGPLHLWIAALFAALTLTAAWRQRARRFIAGATAALVLGQVCLGIAVLASPGGRALGLGWAHAMVACALAIVLVSLAARRAAH